jgi:hypothetical protein
MFINVLACHSSFHLSQAIGIAALSTYFFAEGETGKRNADGGS